MESEYIKPVGPSLELRRYIFWIRDEIFVIINKIWLMEYNLP
jgi:hypothetical protein